MAQYSFIKSAGDVLIPASPDAREFVKKIRLGAVLYSDFKQARNPAFHRKFFALLNLGFDYWQPSGGAISPADKKLVRGYVQLVAHYAGHGDTLQELADQYLRDEAEKRAGNISAVKSFEAFRAWVTIEAGFYNEYQMPDGTIRKEPKSISFAKMDDLEFSQLYKSVLDVLWNFILFRTFPTHQAAENAASQLFSYAA
ncbi:TPA: DUF1367 family protein [Klebsiella pneumoniae]|uniref:Protein of uncharacterized function (DUF1367) n=1 Tax=Klebsiella pneumoniae TaxID=573 RepID=A0ABD7NHZ7_KLEPN|nr:DUF1367 family protein [Klebsiella pneumoniae]SVS23813.1 Protein of uncharacterised function (DUF1367) [Klebsiella pneumoniae]HDK6524385.1 DUF1367 family protein [Klebsiella pneumoniae]HEE0831195.1 DUF1367 family protein [Klebsiella pneumoniae]